MQTTCVSSCKFVHCCSQKYRCSYCSFALLNLNYFYCECKSCGSIFVYVCTVHFSRILSIACGPSTSTFAFAAAASSSSHHMGSSFLTSSLTSPGLPSSRVLTNEMTQFSRPGVMGRSSSSSLRKGELPTAGGVFIWDLKTQKQKVFRCYSHFIYAQI